MREQERAEENMREKKKETGGRKREVGARLWERELEEGPSLGISKPEPCGSWGDVRRLSGLM